MVTATGLSLASFLKERVPVGLAEMLYGFARAGIRIRNDLETAPIQNLLVSSGLINAQQEEQATMDARAHDYVVEQLHVDGVNVLISEEVEQPIVCGHGRYTGCFDPLDGSSNLGIAPVGSILGVYQDDGLRLGSNGSIYAQGKDQVAAAFMVYSVPMMLVLTVRQGVQGFTFNPGTGEWILSHPNIHLPKATYTSVNWAYKGEWSSSVEHAVEAASSGLKGRYSGSLVEDILRILLKGGVFFYPEDKKSPEGKLRMTFEECPIALIMQEAGGSSSDGERDILEKEITHPHQRSSFVSGDTERVLTYKTWHRAV